MPLYEGIGIGGDKHSVVIELGHSFTKYCSFQSPFEPIIGFSFRCGFVNEYSPRAIIRSQVFIGKLNKVCISEIQGSQG